MKYVVTAINKLSGEREVISSPRSLDVTQALMQKHLKEIRYKHYQPWADLRIEEATKQEKLW